MHRDSSCSRVYQLPSTTYRSGSSPCDGSALSAMSGRVIFPKQHQYSQEFCELVKWVLTVDVEERPGVAEVQQRIESMLQAYR